MNQRQIFKLLGRHWRPLCGFLLLLTCFISLKTYIHKLRRQHKLKLQKLLHLTPYNPLRPTDYTDGPFHPNEFTRAMFKYLEKKFGGKRNGFFIECGASDGSYVSNTLDLEKNYSWTGLLIEPDQLAFPKLKARNRRAWISDLCLSPKPFPTKLNFSGLTWGKSRPWGSGMTRVVYRKDDKRNINVFTRHFQVECYPLDMFLDAIGVKQVDFFSLDVEWMEVPILKTIPWDRLDIKVISIEARGAKVKNDTFKLMTSVGYERIKEFEVPEDYLFDDVYERKETEGAQELRRKWSVELGRSASAQSDWVVE